MLYNKLVDNITTKWFCEDLVKSTKKEESKQDFWVILGRSNVMYCKVYLS